MDKREKRIKEVIEHLLGTKLALYKTLTEAEQNDVAFVRDILTQITQTAPNYKWERVNAA